MEITGLNEEEVVERKKQGLVNDVEEQVSRTYKEIIIGNTFTWFNIVLFSLGAILILLGKPMDALFATGILMANVLIATVQECKAKRRLDAIALLLKPKVTAIRNGQEKIIDKTEIVIDDIIKLSPGDQLLVDGVLIYAEYLELDEAVMTGESSSVKKRSGDEVHSGTFVVAGNGYFKVTGIGKNTLAYKMIADAKKSSNKDTPLQKELNSLIKIMMQIGAVLLFLMVVSGVLTNQFSSDLNANVEEFVRDAIIALDVVPLALFLMIIISYMVAAIRMSDSGVLLQKSNAVESMSHVDVVCMDKTGTITTQNLIYKSMKTYVRIEEAKKIVKAFANSTGSKNKTIQAILDKFGEAPIWATEEIRFSSERKFSAVKVTLEGKTITIYAGAKNVFGDRFKDTMLSYDALRYSEMGYRTLVIAIGPDVDLLDENFQLPELKLIALVAIEDEVRADCKDTIANFIDNGMEIKIISGDDPVVVDSLFTIANIPGKRNIISGPELEKLEGKEKTNVIMETNIFGRMKPEQKEEVISTLKDNGKYVAMVGDGVNDVRSLKAANIGISLESGTSAAKGVSDMVLVKDNFAALPKALLEGKRTISGMRDLLKVYISRNFTIAALIFLITVLLCSILIMCGNTEIGHMRPFDIRPASVYGFITVSIPTVLMVFWAIPDDNKEPVLPNVLRYAVPMAIIIGIFGFLIFFGFQYAAYEGLIDEIIAIDSTTGDEYIGNGQGALMAFLLMAGSTQVLFVQPYIKFFSLDGRLHKDIKPTILVLVLYAVIAGTYILNGNWPWFNEMLQLINVPMPQFILIIGITVVWFFVARTILRSSLFNKFNDKIDKGFSKQANRIDEKEANNKARMEEMRHKYDERKEAREEARRRDRYNN